MLNVKNKRTQVLIYSFYSYGIRLFWLLMDLLPHFIRNIIFKIIFKSFGFGCLVDYCTFVRYPWRVSIGNNVAINRGCEIYPSIISDNGFVYLEDGVVLSPGVTIFSASHDYSSVELPDISQPVRIGKNSWVGGKAILLPGVIIGEDVVIGSGSVVSGNIPPNTVAYGNPARVAKNRFNR